MRGILLVAHGSSNPLWTAHFEALRAAVAARAPDRPVGLCFLELCDPGFQEGVDALLAQGCNELKVVPVFLAPGKLLKEIPRSEVLGWIESVLRVYNQYGRRDNLYMARIKILVDALGIETFREPVEADFAALYTRDLAITDARWNEIKAHWSEPA